MRTFVTCMSLMSVALLSACGGTSGVQSAGYVAVATPAPQRPSSDAAPSQITAIPTPIATLTGTVSPVAKAAATKAAYAQPSVAPKAQQPDQAAATSTGGNLCGAPANPYGFNYCGRGADVTSPPADICNYFSCIANFNKGVGYMAECNDGMVSMSGGRKNSCSHHGGELRPVTG